VFETNPGSGAGELAAGRADYAWRQFGAPGEHVATKAQAEALGAAHDRGVVE
jgi:hypothetical protein